MIDGIKVWCIKATVRVSTPRGCSYDAQLMIIESTSVVAWMIIYSVSENQGTFSDYHQYTHILIHLAVGEVPDTSSRTGLYFSSGSGLSFHEFISSRLSKII